jgi:hypothetical protein
VKVLFASALFLFTLGCAGASSHAPCQRDSDCPRQEVCFVDGCGNPAQDVVVEVVRTDTDKPYPEQFAIPTLTAHQDLELSAPPLLAGTLQQATPGAPRSPYLAVVNLVANGFKLLLPDQQLQYQSLVTPQPGFGAYAVPVAPGLYTVAAFPKDVTLPPLFQTGVTVSPGTAAPLNFVLPDVSQLLPLSGVVEIAPGQPLAVPLTVQALTPDAGQRPLSQTLPVGDGGSFNLNLSPEAAGLSEVLLSFKPATADALAPQATFMVSLPWDAGTVVDFGDFGSSFTVQGALSSSVGPVVGAAVQLQGQVDNGGTFTSAVALTDGDGGFALKTLASDAMAGFILTATPPQKSPAGILAQSVVVGAGTPNLGVFVCPNRVTVQGVVTEPDGVTPASGVTVSAVPVSLADGGKDLPSGDKVSTDANGAFALYLDPATYRVDFAPLTNLPWSSAFVEVLGSITPLVLPTQVLSNGQVVSGTVSAIATPGAAPRPAANAQVYFYRRVQGLSGLTEAPLGQTFTDAQGHYSILIPQ